MTADKKMSVSKLFSGVAMAALTLPAVANTSPDMDLTNMETVVVLGMGQTRQIQSVTTPDLMSAAPGTSPIKIVEEMPSVNYQAADTFGAYEWAVRISVRGFNQNKMGFTLDDVPLGDMSYGNYNGLHISRAVSTENLGKVDLMQGSGALATASTSNLGGTLVFHTSDPLENFGVQVSTSAGSADTYHEFVRIDSGKLPGGGSGYVSYSYQTAHKWKGDGLQKQQQINAKYVQPIGPVTLSGYFDYSVRRENDYQDMSLSLIKRLGYKWDNISDDWSKAEEVARIYQNNTSGNCGENDYPSPFDCVDDAYYNAAGLRNDALGRITADWSIFDTLTLHVTTYGHNNKGMGKWATPYVASPDGTPISVRTTEYGISRYGVITNLTWVLGNHTIEAGYWYENNLFHQARRYYALTEDDHNFTLRFQTHAFATSWEYKFLTLTNVFHIEDDWQITPSLKLEYGFKAQQVNNTAHLIVGSISGKISASSAFLPQVGVNYTLDAENEVFANYSRNQSAFVSAATSGPFSTTQDGFDAIKDNLKPETTQTVEGGYRYTSQILQGLIAAYYVKFKNRLLATTLGSGVQGNPSALSNVGSVTSYGFETAGTWHFLHDFSLFVSYAYNASTYDDNTYDGDGDLYAATKNKTTVDAPRHMLKGHLGYDDGTVFGTFEGTFMSRRYYTYTNDNSVPDQTIFNLTAGYRIHADSFIDGFEIQGNITNLFDRKYISAIGTNGFVATDPDGTTQTMMVGAPRQFFITLRKQF